MFADIFNNALQKIKSEDLKENVFKKDAPLSTNTFAIFLHTGACLAVIQNSHIALMLF